MHRVWLITRKLKFGLACPAVIYHVIHHSPAAVAVMIMTIKDLNHNHIKHLPRASTMNQEAHHIKTVQHTTISG